MSLLLSFGTAHFKTESEAGNNDVRSEAGTNLRSSRIFCIYSQGGDTRREEVLSKGFVDISIHINSHASVTAQN